MKAKIIALSIEYKDHTEPFYTAHEEGWKAVNVIKIISKLESTEFAFYSAQGQNEEGQFTWALFTDYGSIIAHTPYTDEAEHDQVFEEFIQDSIIELFKKYVFDVDNIKEHLAKSKRKAIGMIGLQPIKEPNATDQSGQVH